MDDLVAFLRAREAERESKAQAALRFHPAPWRLDPTVQTNLEVGRWVADANDEGVLVANGDSPAKFFADNDPQFVLADVEAKRQIIDLVLDDKDGVACANRLVEGEYDDDMQLPERLLKLLALPYAGRPGWREEWRA